MEKTEEVAIKVIIERIMILDFKVIRVAYFIPSLKTVRGPKLNHGTPALVRGRKTQRNRIKPFTIIRTFKTSFKFTLDIMIKDKG